MKKSLLVLAYALSTAAAFAGDVSKTEFLGFSADGGAVGFQESGTQDGSGFPYCSIMIVDTKKNKYIASSTVQIEREVEVDGEEKACVKARAKSNVKKALAKLKLSTRRGLKNFERLITDEAGANAMKVRFATYPSTSGNFSEEVTLTETNTGAQDEMGVDLKKMTLTLSSENGKSVKVLQQDVSLPPSRSRAIGYELESGYSFETAMTSVQVIVVRVHKTGFEGPDVRAMIVSGTRN